MSNQNIIFYILGMLVCYFIFVDGKTSEEAPVAVPQGYAFISLTPSAYLEHKTIVDSLITVGEASVISDTDELQLSVSQQSVDLLLKIKHPDSYELPWYARVGIALVFIVTFGLTVTRFWSEAIAS